MAVLSEAIELRPRVVTFKAPLREATPVFEASQEEIQEPSQELWANYVSSGRILDPDALKVVLKDDPQEIVKFMPPDFLTIPSKFILEKDEIIEFNDLERSHDPDRKEKILIFSLKIRQREATENLKRLLEKIDTPLTEEENHLFWSFRLMSEPKIIPKSKPGGGVEWGHDFEGKMLYKEPWQLEDLELLDEVVAILGGQKKDERVKIPKAFGKSSSNGVRAYTEIRPTHAQKFAGLVTTAVVFSSEEDRVRTNAVKNMEEVRARVA